LTAFDGSKNSKNFRKCYAVPNSQKPIGFEDFEGFLRDFRNPKYEIFGGI